ncbi:acyl-CoA N-acyltransferase [Lactarius indigo]|nr:acyl-CoA N-acyltransferase [Lactarius indigo]
MSASVGYFIRPVQPEDVPSVVQLVYELALYEKVPQLAVATPKLAPGEAIGFALYFFNFSTWTGKPGIYLEDLYVKEEHRNKGIGKAFFKQLAVVAQEKDCSRMDWTVLKWNQPSIDFYEKYIHAKPQDERLGMRLEVDGIENLRNITTKEG